MRLRGATIDHDQLNHLLNLESMILPSTPFRARMAVSKLTTQLAHVTSSDLLSRTGKYQAFMAQKQKSVSLLIEVVHPMQQLSKKRVSVELVPSSII